MRCNVDETFDMDGEIARFRRASVALSSHEIVPASIWLVRRDRVARSDICRMLRRNESGTLPH